MAGAGIQVTLDSEYQNIINALQKAAAPQLQQIAHAAGLDLQKVSRDAFKNEADPATGTKWKARLDATNDKPLLVGRGTLRRSIIFQAFPDGSLILGSNLVYAGIHQNGGQTKAHEIKARNGKALHFNGRFARRVQHPGSKIPARPYLGVPRNFERDFFDDPKIKSLLGIAAGGEA